MSKYVDIVFDGPPSHESGRFVEVENDKGASIRFGEWVEREDGYWVLRIRGAECDLRFRLALIAFEADELADADPESIPEARALLKILGYADLNDPIDPWLIKQHHREWIESQKEAEGLRGE